MSNHVIASTKNQLKTETRLDVRRKYVLFGSIPQQLRARDQSDLLLAIKIVAEGAFFRTLSERKC